MAGRRLERRHSFSRMLAVVVVDKLPYPDIEAPAATELKASIILAICVRPVTSKERDTAASLLGALTCTAQGNCDERRLDVRHLLGVIGTDGHPASRKAAAEQLAQQVSMGRLPPSDLQQTRSLFSKRHGQWCPFQLDAWLEQVLQFFNRPPYLDHP